MPSTPSPLRYPGGKSAIWKMIAKIIEDNRKQGCHYVEPYAGGCGLALSLLFRGYVNELHLNDLDRSIWCFWNAALNDTERFVRKIKRTAVTLDEWYKQREIQENKDYAEDFELAFSSLFLNRTNRSGIILKAGVIGGFRQSGKYKLDCRFNKDSLVEKIRRIGKCRSRIYFYNFDAAEFIVDISKYLPPMETFFCIDPPYYAKGSTLYTNSYESDDHKEIANIVTRLSRSWVLTYDNVPEIQNLYSKCRQYYFGLTYTAANKRRATELLVASDDLIISSQANLTSVA